MKCRKMSFFVCMMLFLFCGISVKAAECQLSVSLGSGRNEVELSIYKIADVQKGAYEWCSEYQGIDVDLSGLSNAQKTKEAAKKIYRWISEKNIPAEQTGVTNENGVVAFSVKSGAYLIAKTSEKGEMSPVLLTVPEDYQSKSLDISPKYSESKESEGTDTSSTPNHSSANASGQGKGAGTGDQANVILWILLMAVALAGIYVIMKRKSSDDKKE